MSVFVVRAFVRIRSLLVGHKVLATKVAEIEHKLTVHDKQIVTIVEAVKQLMLPVAKARRTIGFNARPPDPRPKPKRR